MSNSEQEFEQQIENTLADIRALLIEKGREYRRNKNPYHNFERGAELSGRTREEVLQGFLLKHLISAEDIRNDMKFGTFPTPEKINEKYNDIIVYFLIEKAMIVQSAEAYGKSVKTFDVATFTGELPGYGSTEEAYCETVKGVGSAFKDEPVCILCDETADRCECSCE